MNLELCYTSAARGLRPGRSGYCTVAATAGLSRALCERLESLSVYPPTPVGSAGIGPAIWSHWRVPVAEGRSASVLSRVAPSGVDHTGRPNFFAHHIVAASSALPVGGPAWVLRQPGVMRECWIGAPREIPAREAPVLFATPTHEVGPRICQAWEGAAGDAGWAGVLAESCLVKAPLPCWIIYPPHIQVLALIEEAMALLPARRRWRVTFSSLFTFLPAGLDCAWRFVPAGTPSAAAALSGGGLVIDLTAGSLRPPAGAGADAARLGHILSDASPPATPPSRVAGTRDLREAHRLESDAPLPRDGMRGGVSHG